MNMDSDSATIGFVGTIGKLLEVGPPCCCIPMADISAWFDEAGLRLGFDHVDNYHVLPLSHNVVHKPIRPYV